jgi:hypothetical protein
MDGRAAVSLLLAQRFFAWSSRATRGKARCALHLFVALLFSKFDIVYVPPPDELEQPSGCFLFQPGPLLNEPEPRADAGAWRLQLYFDFCALSVISFPAPPRPPLAAEPAPLPRASRRSRLHDFTPMRPITAIRCVPGTCARHACSCPLC